VTPAAAGGRKWSLRRYLVAGILIWLPILATLWVVTFFIHIMDETLLLLPLRYRPEALVGFALPGLARYSRSLWCWRLGSWSPI